MKRIFIFLSWLIFAGVCSFALWYSTDLNRMELEYKAVQDKANKTLSDYTQNKEVAKSKISAILTTCVTGDLNSELKDCVTDDVVNQLTSWKENALDDAYAKYNDEYKTVQDKVETYTKLHERYILNSESLSDAEKLIMQDLESLLKNWLNDDGSVKPHWFAKYTVNRNTCFTQYGDDTTIQLINVIGYENKSLTILVSWKNGKIVKLERNLRGDTV